MQPGWLESWAVLSPAKTCVSTGNLKVSLVTPDPVPSRQGQGQKHQACVHAEVGALVHAEGGTREKWARREKEGGKKRKEGQQNMKEMGRREQKKEKRKVRRK